MRTDFFVMLYTNQKGDYTPLMDDNDVAKFHTVEDARNAAMDNVFGDLFGFEVFEMGTGE